MSAIKGVGDKAVDAIVAAREEGGPFASLYDFCERVDMKLVNRRVVESFVPENPLAEGEEPEVAAKGKEAGEDEGADKADA